MYLKPATAIVVLSILQSLNLMADELPRHTSYQSDASITNKTSSGEKSPMSDRERAGLRGPVQQCTEEQAIPAFENVPAATYTTTTKYSPQGRILQSTTSNSVEAGPPEFSTTYTYDSTGLLLKQTITSPGSPAVESKYNYDDKRRVVSITGNPEQTSTFEYDDQGHKTRILSPGSAIASALPASVAYEFPAPEDEDPYLPIPARGRTKILFNEQNQPVEWQVSDANGNLVNRLIRTYDENGRLAELRYTMENVLLTFPVETQEELLADDPAAAEELSRQFTQLLGEQRNLTRTTYRYDADGRLIEKHNHMGPSVEIISKTAYNEHFDKSEELTVTIGDSITLADQQSGEPSSSTPPPSQKSVTRYSYKYDNFGNWTEQRTASASSANDATVIRRTLIYYSSESL
jgi:YD repeat-containing protein